MRQANRWSGEFIGMRPPSRRWDCASIRTKRRGYQERIVALRSVLVRTRHDSTACDSSFGGRTFGDQQRGCLGECDAHLRCLGDCLVAYAGNSHLALTALKTAPSQRVVTCRRRRHLPRTSFRSLVHVIAADPVMRSTLLVTLAPIWAGLVEWSFLKKRRIRCSGWACWSHFLEWVG